MKVAQVPATINGHELVVKEDSVIQPDGWRLSTKLLPGDHFSSLRISTGWEFGIQSLAVEVRITGRTFQRIEGSYWTRVEITFVGDGEPDQKHGGWMSVEHLWAQHRTFQEAAATYTN